MAVLAAADTTSYIPQIGRVGSLNVAIAAAIAIAETRRREWDPTATGHTPADRTSPHANLWDYFELSRPA